MGIIYKKADLDETYPADILLEFVKEFVDEHRSELVDDPESKPKKVIVRKAAPKKKSFWQGKLRSSKREVR
ncbi:MAG: hypothetical protein CM15mP42_09990 [Methanobacteriota archaeon]|nr:MAG: hypothetical protein CM15mP42_09990 [Euryarchaeota archaeon]